MRSEPSLRHRGTLTSRTSTNPISNKRIRFAYRPLPEQLPADPGYSHVRADETLGTC
jgi:hypothetical protein